MNGITFSLVPVADEISPNKKVYRAYVKTNGTVDKEDAEFDPKRNSLYVGATLSQELRDAVACIAPDFKGDTTVGDTVTVTIEIDPSKAEAYRAGTMEMSAIVA